MSVTPVIPDPATGRYRIRGRDNQDLELTLDARDLGRYLVEQLTDQDMNAKLPTSATKAIRWFACFGVYERDQSGGRGKEATVTYTFPVKLQDNQEFWVAYGGNAYDKTDEVRRTGQVRMSEGDPATGFYP
jgi:hypothetical protein